eukprot:985891-Prymnesium_polylepis.1
MASATGASIAGASGLTLVRELLRESRRARKVVLPGFSTARKLRLGCPSSSSMHPFRPRTSLHADSKPTLFQIVELSRGYLANERWPMADVVARG